MRQQVRIKGCPDWRVQHSVQHIASYLLLVARAQDDAAAEAKVGGGHFAVFQVGEGNEDLVPLNNSSM